MYKRQVNFDYDVKVFVAGIEVKDNEFDFSIKKAAFNARTGVLEIKAITVSYTHLDVYKRQMQSPSWSPDSRQLAYVTQDDRLCIYNLNDEPDDCPFAPEGLLMEAAWSPTGSLIAAAVVTPPVEGSSDCCDGRVWLVDAATGAATDVAGFITGLEYALGEAFQWLADSSGLAIKRTGDSGGSTIYRPGDGSVVTFAEWIADRAPDGGTMLHPSGCPVSYTHLDVYKRQLRDPV